MLLLRVAAGTAIVGALLLMMAGPTYRLGASLPTAFAVMRWAAYAGVAALVVGLAAAAITYRTKRRAGTAVAVLAMLIGAITVAIPFSWQRTAQRVPPIHDITTDLENPPMFQAVLPLRADAPNKLERSPVIDQQQREGYPDLGPVTLSQPAERAFDRALAVAQESGWEIVTADKAGGRIEATDTTRWFGFKDDIAIRLTPWGAGTRVDLRSVSRVGRSDVGTNARRIRDFLDAVAE